MYTKASMSADALRVEKSVYRQVVRVRGIPAVRKEDAAVQSEVCFEHFSINILQINVYMEL